LVVGLDPSEDHHQPRKSTAAVIVRWLAVVPAAYFFSWSLRGVGPAFLSLGGMIDLRGPGYPSVLFPLVYYLPSGAAFTLTGALIAPRARRIIASILATSCAGLSLLRHVILHPNPGLTNYMHATGESLGAAIGVGTILYLCNPVRSVAQVESRNDRAGDPPSEDGGNQVNSQ